MSQYQRGHQFEKDTREHLREHGYTVVRSAASKTKIDLIAWKFGEILFVQCKVGKSPVGTAEWNEVFAAGHAVPSCKAIVAHKEPGRKMPQYWLLLQPRLPRSRAIHGTHWIDWTPDEVADVR